MKYFYIVYVGNTGAGVGNCAIRQSTDGPLDLASAHTFLYRTVGAAVIITAWQEITEPQYVRFCDFIETIQGKKNGPTPIRSEAKVLQLKPRKGPASTSVASTRGAGEAASTGQDRPVRGPAPEWKRDYCPGCGRLRTMCWCPPADPEAS